MPVDTDDRELSIAILKLFLQHVEIGPDRMVDKLRAGQIDDDVLRLLAAN